MVRDDERVACVLQIIVGTCRSKARCLPAACVLGTQIHGMQSSPCRCQVLPQPCNGGDVVGKTTLCLSPSKTENVKVLHGICSELNSAAAAAALAAREARQRTNRLICDNRLGPYSGKCTRQKQRENGLSLWFPFTSRLPTVFATFDCVLSGPPRRGCHAGRPGASSFDLAPANHMNMHEWSSRKGQNHCVDALFMCIYTNHIHNDNTQTPPKARAQRTKHALTRVF